MVELRRGHMKRDINDAWLRTLAPPATGRTEVRDARVAGLILRVTPNGVATWSVRARTREGKQTRPTLGMWPAMSIAVARKASLAAIATVQGGADPVAEKRKLRASRRWEKAEARAATKETVAARLEEWQAARIADPSSAWSPRYSAEVSRVCDQAVTPALGAKPLRETTRQDWTALIQGWRRTVTTRPRRPGEKRKAGAPVKDGAGASAFLYRTVSAFLNFAEAHGWIDAPLLPRKGAGLIAPPPPARERVLTDDELAAVWQAADREPPKLRAFVRLLILTAARELEVADIAAGEVDLAAGRWRVPGERTKNGVGYTVPLSPLAAAELRAVWPDEEPAPDHKLLGRVAGSGFRGFGKLKARMDAAAKVTGWRWHDLRRTARTGMTRIGVPREHAEAAINHLSGRSKLERTYDRYDYADEVVAALMRWQAHVASLVATPVLAEVLSLRCDAAAA
jgi:integrase